MNCNLYSQEVFDLVENYFVDLPSVFSVPSLPVSSDSIPTREDVISFSERSILISACLLDVMFQRPWNLMKLVLIKAKAHL